MYGVPRHISCWWPNKYTNDAIGSINQVGDIILRHVHRFMDAYLKYGPYVVLAEFEAKREAEKNILFQTFVREKEKR